MKIPIHSSFPMTEIFLAIEQTKKSNRSETSIAQNIILTDPTIYNS